MTELDAYKVPLVGRNIVEAGAGTGKTYSIQTLVARLIVENGIECDKIFVVTFTREATAELQRRLRQVLEDISVVVASGCGDGDERARKIVHNAETAGISGDVIEKRVRQALTDFDAMRISTIHGFCFRILSEFAVAGRVRTALELKNSGSEVLEKIMEDFQRKNLYGDNTSEVLTRLWLSCGFSPEVLTELLKNALASENRIFYGKLPRQSLKEAAEAVECACEQLRAIDDRFFIERNSALFSLLYSENIFAAAEVRSTVEDVLVKKRMKNPVIAVLLRIGEDGVAEKCILQQLEGKKLAADESKKAMEVFSRAEKLKDQLEIFYCTVLSFAVQYASCELEARVERDGVIDYNLVLTMLRDKLADQENGENFTTVIAENVRALIVDEFQDTDSVQLEIFNSISKKLSPDIPVFFIGDPKQAIYAFRGGDIFCYLDAVATVEDDKKYTLTVNYRSGKRFIEAMNDFYSCQPDPFALGVVLPYRTAGIVHEKDDILCTKGAVNSLSFMESSAENIAKEIAAMLGEKSSYSIILEKETSAPRHLRPSDFAVLVNKNREAPVVAGALKKYDIPVQIYEAENALNAPEINDFCFLLEAILNPADSSLLVRALSTVYFAYTACDIAEAEKNGIFHVFMGRNRNLLAVWKNHSLEAMFRTADKYYDISGNILSVAGGRRIWSLTRRWLDLAAVLEEKEQLQPDALLERFIKEKNPASRSFSDEACEIQLQDDEDAVKVLTVHKSKGLQFPVVYALDMGFVPKIKNRSRLFHNENKQRCFDLSWNFLKSSLCRREECEENLRRAYVAVTRAAVMFRGGISGSGAKSKDGLIAYLRQGSADDLFVFSSLPDETITPFPQKPEPEMYCRSAEGISIQSGWDRTSFSAMTANSGYYSTAEDETADEMEEDNDINNTYPHGGSALFEYMAAFPKGSRTGNAWHKIMETIHFDWPVEKIAAEVEKCLAEFSLFASGEDKESRDNVAAMIHKMLNTKLPCGGFRLADIPHCDMVSEMEFMIPAEINTDLHGICSRLPEYAMDSSSGQKREAHVVSGAMDIVFRYGGKYYIADWKSNKIGNKPDDYLQNNLEKIMRSKYYILQSLIYLNALKKYMNWQSEEDYNNKFGGIYYFFMRGCCCDLPGCGIWTHRPEWSVFDKLEEALAGNE